MSKEEDIRTFLGSVRIHDSQVCISTAISKNMFLCTGYCTRYLRFYGTARHEGTQVHPIENGKRGLYGYPVIDTLEYSSSAIEENSASASGEGSTSEETLTSGSSKEEILACAKNWMEKYEIGLVVVGISQSIAFRSQNYFQSDN